MLLEYTKDVWKESEDMVWSSNLERGGLECIGCVWGKAMWRHHHREIASMSSGYLKGESGFSPTRIKYLILAVQWSD